MMPKVEQICDSKDCSGCGACYQKCPKAAISMVENAEGFLNPVIDKNECIGCQQCLKVCPQNHDSRKNEAHFYMGWNNDIDVLKTSSSGGIFAALAEYVFKNDGVVFGAVLRQDTRTVEHVCARSEGELEPLKLSKYYQSNTKYTYKDVKTYLEEGIPVLYSGTACQIAGLYAYLGKDYANLVTVDVLCHGVGSKKIVDAYVKSKEHHFRKKVKQIFFRYKDDIVGWQNGGGTRMKLTFEDGTTYIAEKADDTFFIGFNKNFFLRESCYNCKFCGTARVADFTIADFWGCNREEVSDEQKKLGVSLILANTDKAESILSELQAEEVLTVHNVEPHEAIPYNRSLDKPNNRPAQRDKFYKWVSIFGYDLVIKRIFWKKFTKLMIKKVLRIS